MQKENVICDRVAVQHTPLHPAPAHIYPFQAFEAGPVSGTRIFEERKHYLGRKAAARAQVAGRPVLLVLAYLIALAFPIPVRKSCSKRLIVAS